MRFIDAKILRVVWTVFSVTFLFLLCGTIIFAPDLLWICLDSFITFWATVIAASLWADWMKERPPKYSLLTASMLSGAMAYIAYKLRSGITREE